MTNNEIKTPGEFDIDKAVIALAALIFVVHENLDNLYASTHPAIVWNENAATKEALRISSEVKAVSENLRNMEIGQAYSVLDREINRLTNLYSSIHPAIVWNENAATKEALRISSKIEDIRRKLVDIKALSHKIDEYYDENE